MAVPRRASADHASLFLDRYQQLLHDARRLAGASDAARDLVHDAFVQFVSQAPPLETIDRVDAYLHGMLRKLHLSRRRRAGVRLELAVSDYDSLDTAIRLPDPERRMEVAHQLAAVCRYACARKESSKTGSVLILRFFRGLYPEEVARISGLSTEAVAQWLRLARAESRTALETPGRLRFLGRARGVADARLASATMDGPLGHCGGPLVSADLRASDGPEVWVAALRHAIAASRRGPCLSEEDIDARLGGAGAVGSGSMPAALDTAALAHVASCEPCLLRLSGRVQVQVDPAAGLDTALGRAPRLFVRAAVALAIVLAFFTYRAELHAAAHVVGDLLRGAWSHVSSMVRTEPRGKAMPGAVRNGDPAPGLITSPPSGPGGNIDDAVRARRRIASQAASRESLADVEVAILEALDGADALAGEEVAVTRTEGGLRVRGIVDDPARRRYVMGLLRGPLTLAASRSVGEGTGAGVDGRVEVVLRSSGAAAARAGVGSARRVHRGASASARASASRMRVELIDVAARSYPLLPHVERWLLGHPEQAGRFGTDTRAQALRVAREVLRHASEARMRMAVAMDLTGRFDTAALAPGASSSSDADIVIGASQAANGPLWSSGTVSAARRARLDRLVRRHLAIARGELKALESWLTLLAGSAARRDAGDLSGSGELAEESFLPRGGGEGVTSAVIGAPPSARDAFETVCMVDALAARLFAVHAPSAPADEPGEGGRPARVTPASSASVSSSPSRGAAVHDDVHALSPLMNTLGTSIASLKQLEDWLSHDES